MRYVLVACLIVVGTVALAGCSDNKEPDDISVQSLRWDMHGDLYTPVMTREENHSRSAHTMTMNMRKFEDDIRRLMLFDHASRSMDHPTIQE
jgi:hypothetical protein